MTFNECRNSCIDSTYDDDDVTPRNHGDTDTDNNSMCMSESGDMTSALNSRRRSHSPVPSLAVTDGDYGVENMDTQRSTLQR